MFNQDQIKYDEWNQHGVGGSQQWNAQCSRVTHRPPSHLFIHLHFWEFFYSEIEMCRIKIRSTIFLDLILKAKHYDMISLIKALF